MYTYISVLGRVLLFFLPVDIQRPVSVLMQPHVAWDRLLVLYDHADVQISYFMFYGHVCHPPAMMRTTNLSVADLQTATRYDAYTLWGRRYRCIIV